MVKIRNEKTGQYLPPVSTKHETEAAAIRTAFDWLKDGIPRKDETLFLQKHSIRKLIKEIEISKPDAEYLYKHLQQTGLPKSYVLTESKQAVVVIDYPLDFWSWEKSPYIREKLRKRYGIQRRYVIGQA